MNLFWYFKESLSIDESKAINKLLAILDRYGEGDIKDKVLASFSDHKGRFAFWNETLFPVHVFLIKKLNGMTEREYLECFIALRAIMPLNSSFGEGSVGIALKRKLRIALDSLNTSTGRESQIRKADESLPVLESKPYNFSQNAKLSQLVMALGSDFDVLSSVRAINFLALIIGKDNKLMKSSCFISRFMPETFYQNKRTIDMWYEKEPSSVALLSQSLMKNYLAYYQLKSDDVRLFPNELHGFYHALLFSAFKRCDEGTLEVLISSAKEMDYIVGCGTEKQKQEWDQIKKKELKYIRDSFHKSYVYPDRPNTEKIVSFANKIKGLLGQDVKLESSYRNINIGLMKRSKEILRIEIGESDGYYIKDLKIGKDRNEKSSTYFTMFDILSLKAMSDTYLLTELPEHLRLLIVKYGLVDVFDAMAINSDDAIIDEIMDAF